jgi:hypothetical protein
MTTQTKPLAEVTHRAIEILTRELGAADTLRFVGQFTTGYGDYTAEREALFANRTLDEMIAEIKAPAGAPRSPRPSRSRARPRTPRARPESA